MGLVNFTFPKEQVGRDKNAYSDIIDSERVLKTRANILAWKIMQYEKQHNCWNTTVSCFVTV